MPNVLFAGTKKYISVDREIVTKNRELGENNPPLVVEWKDVDGKWQEMHGRSISWNGKSELVYKPGNVELEDLQAVAWVETTTQVIVR